MIKNLMFSLALVFLSGCSCERATKAEKAIETAKPENEEEKVYVINVLDKELYDDCHIKGSVNVPFMDSENPDKNPIEDFVKELPKNTKMVIYCSNYMCSASGEIAKQLQTLGFENVWAYEAGLAEWHQQGLPVEGMCKQGYLNKKVNPPSSHSTDIKLITTEQLKELLKL